MKNNFLRKMLFIILILAIFYCLYMNTSGLREGLTSASASPTKCSDIKNCKGCGSANFSSGDGICYWCDGKCESGSNYSKYASGKCSRDINVSGCSDTDVAATATSTVAATVAATATSSACPNCPALVDIPAGTKMTLQHT
jgi:hypothetical protein